LNRCALSLDPSINSAFPRFQDSDNWLLIGCLSLFGLVVVFGLLWALVIAPRRAGRLLRELSERGYAETDKTGLDLLSAMDTLASFMLEGTAGENPRFNQPRSQLSAKERAAHTSVMRRELSCVKRRPSVSWGIVTTL
jgi:hypothetical protein